MKNQRTLIASTLALVIGLLIGLALYIFPPGSPSSASRPELNLPDTTEMAQIAMTLTALRQGKTNQAVELLEMKLDSDLMTLAAALRHNHIDLASDKSLSIVRRYRSDYPRLGNTNITSLIGQVWSAISAGSRTNEPIQ